MECVKDSLREILRDESQWPDTIVIKRLPKDEHPDTILNYLEDSMDCMVRHIYRPTTCGTQAVVVLDKQIQTPVRLEQSLGDCKPTIESLGPALGVFVAPLLPETKQHHISEYFKSFLKSGRQLERTECIRGSCVAVVYIKDTPDILAIVCTEDLEIRRQPVCVYPYFKSLHDILINEKRPDIVLRPEATLYENVLGKQPVQQEHPVPLPTRTPEAKAPGFFARFFKPKPPPVPPRNPENQDQGESTGPSTGQTSGPHTGRQTAAETHAPTKLDVIGTIKVSTQSAKLLIIAGLDKSYNSDAVRIEIQLIEGKVVVSAVNKEKLTETELKIREGLEKVHERTIQVSTHFGCFVMRQDIQDNLQLMLKQKDIKAVFGISGTSIKWTGMTKSDVDKGDKLVHNSIEERRIKINEYQLETAQAAVDELNKKVKYTDATAFFTPPALYVDVLSMVGGSGGTLEKDLKKYIADRVESRSGHPIIEVKGQNALFFLRFCQENVSKSLEQRKGKLDIKQYGKGDSTRLELKVTGTKDDIKTVRNTVDNIWHEHLDFSTISADGKDEFMLIKIFSGYLGDGFLSTCEDQFRCILVRTVTGDPQTPMRLPSYQEYDDTNDDEDDDTIDDVPRLPVHVFKTGITSFRANALVNILPPDLNPKHGKITGSFLKAGGQEFEKKFTESASKQKSGSKRDHAQWTMFESPGGGHLHCSVVYHVALSKTTDQSEMRRCIQGVIKRLVQECNKRKFETLALPPLGIGRLYEYDEDLVIQEMVKCLNDSLAGSHLRKATVVVYEGPLTGKFKNALCSLASAIKPAASSKPVAKKKPQKPVLKPQMPAADISGGATKARVTVFAENKKECLKTRKDIKQRIKNEWLYEETMDKVQGLSGETKERIVEILNDKNVRSISVKDHFILRGEKEMVRDAKCSIQTVIIKYKDSSKQSHKNRGPSYPKYWTTTKHGRPQKKGYTRVPLSTTDNAYQVIEKLVTDTFDTTKAGQGKDARGLAHTKIIVTKVERIENTELYSNFRHTRDGMLRSLKDSGAASWPHIKNIPGSTGPVKTDVQDSKFNADLRPEVNEFYFFHGSKTEAVGPICHEGLDFRVGKDQGMYGRGVYGAEMSMKSDQYADDKNNRNTSGELQMFLIRMLLGNTYVCTNQTPPKYVRPPCCQCQQDVCNHESKKYDSVLGDIGKLFREFVVYNGHQCYPEYLITYRRQ